MLIDARLPNANVGSSKAMLSDASSGAFSANMNAITDGADVTGLATTSELCLNAGVACTTAVDAAIAVVAEAMSAAAPSVTPTFLAVSPAACAFALVVTPVATDKVHCVLAGSVAVPPAAVNVSVAVAVPELALAAVNVVVPQPCVSTGDARVPKVKVGSTRATESAAATGAFSAKLYETDDSSHMYGLLTVRMLVLSAGIFTCVDTPIATAAMFVTEAKVTAAVRVLRSAACAALDAVTPAPTVTWH
jgi:hypothetical protein